MIRDSFTITKKTAKIKKGLLAALGRLLPALTLFLSLSASAQERTSNVTGIVRSENGEQLANVTVVAKNNSTNLTSGTQTDS